MRILFLGSKPLGLAALKVLHEVDPTSLAGIITFDDSRDARSALPAFLAYSQTHGVSCEVATDRLHAEALIGQFHPDLCLVVGWYWLIGSDTLKLVRNGFIGLHNSLLPHYRGGSPLVWSMINGDKVLGASLFSFTDGMDDGPLWGQVQVKVGQQDTIGEVLGKLEKSCVALLRQRLPGILAGTIRPREQCHEKATFCAQRFPSDGEVDWGATAQFVHDAIRAQSDPYPGAFTWLNGEKLTIWRATLFEYQYFGMPGQVARVTGDGVYVICGDSRAVILHDIEYQGQRFFAQSVVKSIKIRFPNRVA